MLEKSSQFLSSEQLMESKSLDVALKKLYLTRVRPSMWRGRVLDPLLDCVRAIVHNILVLSLYEFLDSSYKSTFFSLFCHASYMFAFSFYPGGTSHGSPVRTDSFGLHYLILSLYVLLFFCIFVILW